MFCLVALLVACVFVCVVSDHVCYVCPCLWSWCLAMLWCSSYPHTEFLPPSCGSWIIGLVWRLGAFQKGPGAKGTRMEECKKNAKARGEGDEGGKTNAKIMQKKRNQNAKKCKTHATEMCGRRAHSGLILENGKDSKNTVFFFAFSLHVLCSFRVFLFIVLHFFCVLVAFFLVAFFAFPNFIRILFAFWLRFFGIIFACVLPPSSPSLLAFAFFLHSSMRVPFAPGPFWKASSLQTKPMTRNPGLSCSQDTASAS